MTPTHRGTFELRDHTADIALHVRGASIESLFVTAADGLYATIGDLRCPPVADPAIATPQAAARESITLHAADREGLLHHFLSELLYRFEIRHQRLSAFDFDTFDDTALTVSADVAAVNMDASVMDREVKAVTYHDLRIIQSAGGYEVTIVLDI
ncbi:MAG: archease [Phycisphaerales bacterium]|nr:archease [Phycisphaerales bacterium]